MRSASAFSTVPIVVGDGLGREMGKIILSEDERDVHVNNYCGEKKLQQRGILASCQPAGRSAVRLQEWAARPAWESADMPTYDYRNQTFPVILAGMRRCRSSRPALQAAT